MLNKTQITWQMKFLGKTSVSFNNHESIFLISEKNRSGWGWIKVPTFWSHLVIYFTTHYFILLSSNNVLLDTTWGLAFVWKFNELPSEFYANIKKIQSVFYHAAEFFYLKMVFVNGNFFSLPDSKGISIYIFSKYRFLDVFHRDRQDLTGESSGQRRESLCPA